MSEATEYTRWEVTWRLILSRDPDKQITYQKIWDFPFPVNRKIVRREFKDHLNWLKLDYMLLAAAPWSDEIGCAIGGVASE